MGIVRYYMRVLRVAFGHSLSTTQDCIFGAILLVGAVIFFVPRLGMPIDVHSWSEWLSALSGWKIASVAFGTIIAIRLICAPYWMHCELDYKLRKATQRDGIRNHLHQFYVELGVLYSRKFKEDTSEEEFENWVLEVDAWRCKASTWVEDNLGQAAQLRLFDLSALKAGFIIGRLNDRHGDILLRLERIQKNLSLMIESGVWDKPANV